ncbi:BofC C-terminal domain-containing protein [Amphibacillus sediminis]|uniref:BofC C-terminal domain-containing protein n=1 Tax=Amphibacillus sediminis TaxID=360185 RepID=UPI00082CA713|nr:BofC C-terminal domain-containing protein [Amphibacillus sediminis]
MKYLLALNLLLIVTILIYNGSVQESEPNDKEQTLTVSRTEKSEDKTASDYTTIELVIQRQYLDGRMESDTYEESITSMEDFWYTYESYQLIDQRVGQMVFREYVDDISPHLKEVGYFGLEEQNLAIFEGKPQYQQRIQSLYDIDPTILSDDQLAALNEGIKIDSKEIYQETIEVFRNLSKAEQVDGEYRN